MPPHPCHPLVTPQQQDCLFLDVYVLRQAIDTISISPLPVLWIHGGGYGTPPSHLLWCYSWGEQGHIRRRWAHHNLKQLDHLCSNQLQGIKLQSAQSHAYSSWVFLAFWLHRFYKYSKGLRMLASGIKERPWSGRSTTLTLMVFTVMQLRMVRLSLPLWN